MNMKIGIRPVIDGRRGVRAKLEGKTAAMCAAVKRLIEENVRYSNGQRVQCVTAPRSISCAAEAHEAAEYFQSEKVGATVTVTPIFCFGTETMDLDPLTLKAVWGFNGTERPGSVYLATAMSAYAERGLPAFSVYGREVQELDDDTIPADVAEKLLRFTRCAAAVMEMRDASYLSIGGVSMGIAGSFLDPLLLQKTFGMRAEWMDMNEVRRRIECGIFDEAEYHKALSWVRANCPEGENVYGSDHDETQKILDWEYSVKMALVIKDIMRGNPKLGARGFEEESLGRNALAAGFQGQRQWTDQLVNCDLAETLLCSTFDWNGARQPFTLATENDTLNGMTMLLQTLLTGQASVFADVRTYWSKASAERAAGLAPNISEDGFIHLNNSGAAALDGAGTMRDRGEPVMKPWWSVTEEDERSALGATRWTPANLEYFKGGGFSAHWVTRGRMPVTMMRLNRVYGLGPVLQIAEGYTLNLPQQLSDAIEKRTDIGWPSTFFVPRLTGEGSFRNVYQVMADWGSNHSCFTYGHIGDLAVTLASMLRIPVSMHNLPPERVFRPHVWSAFGDGKAADFAACRTFGPLY